MNRVIYQLKKINPLKVSQNSPLDKWFYQMIFKCVDELTCEDIAHMLRQRVFLDIAVPCAWDRIINNPFYGEMFDGELIELLAEVLLNYPQGRDINSYCSMKKVIAQRIDEHEWYDSIEKDNFQKIVTGLELLF